MFFETKYNTEKFRDTFTLPFLVQSAGKDYPQEDVLREQGFFCHQFLWVTEGCGQFTVNGQVMTLSAGQGCFMRRGVPQAYHSVQAPFSTAWFGFWNGEGVLDFYGVGDFFVFDVPPFLPRSFDEFFALCCGNSTPVSRSAAGYPLFITLLQTLFEPNVSLTQRVDAFLESHFARDLSLEEIADAAGMSKYALCHRYKAEQGVTVMEQLRRIRVAKAKQYLAATDRSVAEIGQLCGFRDASYFTKTFREFTALSPRDWRRTYG